MRISTWISISAVTRYCMKFSCNKICTIIKFFLPSAILVLNKAYPTPALFKPNLILCDSTFKLFRQFEKDWLILEEPNPSWEPTTWLELAIHLYRLSEPIQQENILIGIESHFPQRDSCLGFFCHLNLSMMVIYN